MMTKIQPGLVSIVMPAFNGENFIQQAIDSVLSQTYSNWELIIIDDAIPQIILLKLYGDTVATLAYGLFIRRIKDKHPRRIMGWTLREGNMSPPWIRTIGIHLIVCWIVQVI